MCCHTQPARQKLLSALRTADPALGTVSDEQFWHSTRGNALTATPADIQRAIDRVWLAITTSDRFEHLDRERQLRAQQAFLDARTDALENTDSLGLPAVEALERYETGILQQEAHKERGSRVRRVVTSRIIGAALLSIGVMAGSTQPRDANAEALFTQPEVTQSQVTTAPVHDLGSVTLRSVEGGKPTGNGVTYVFSAPTKGRCDAGEVKTVIKKARTVTWEFRNGTVGTKAVKKGQKVCRVATAAATSGYSKDVHTNADGLITRVDAPRGGSTVQWIESLGLTRDSQLAWNFTPLPQPSRPAAAASPAQRLEPVGVVSWSPVEGTDARVWATTEWRLVGGSGLVDIAGHNGTVRLDPNGDVVFTVTLQTEVLGRSHSTTMIQGTLESDYGQANLPPAAIGGWDVDSTRVIAGNANGELMSFSDGASFRIDLSNPSAPTIHSDAPR